MYNQLEPTNYVSVIYISKFDCIVIATLICYIYLPTLLYTY